MKRGSRLLIGLGAAATLLGSRAAAASPEDDKKACIQAYEDAQTTRKQGRFAASRASITACVRPVCPAGLVRDCNGWRAELDAAQPSVVVSARDDAGKALVDVSVEEDGVRLADRLDGAPLPVDPGEHRLVVRDKAGARAEIVVTVAAGDKAHKVEVVLASASPSSPTPTHGAPVSPFVAPAKTPAEVVTRPVPTVSIIFGGVSLGGFATFGVLGGIGLAQRSALDGQHCKPHCKQADVLAVQNSFYWADVGLDVGAVTGVIAAALYVFRPEVSRPAEAATRRPSWSVALDPRGGARFALGF